jgi:hypothetical protein
VVVADHRFGFSLACRGGEEGEAADSPPNAYRSQRLPKRCCGAASSSPLLLLMQCSSREALQRATYAGDALPLHHMADWRPFSWRSDFPRTKKSKGKSYCFHHDAGPSGSSPTPAFVLWRSNSAAILFSGVEQGPDRVFQIFLRVFSIIVWSLSRNPLICRGFSANCTHRELLGSMDPTLFKKKKLICWYFSPCRDIERKISIV